MGTAYGAEPWAAVGRTRSCFGVGGSLWGPCERPWSTRCLLVMEEERIEPDVILVLDVDGGATLGLAALISFCT